MGAAAVKAFEDKLEGDPGLMRKIRSASDSDLVALAKQEVSGIEDSDKDGLLQVRSKLTGTGGSSTDGGSGGSTKGSGLG